MSGSRSQTPASASSGPSTRYTSTTLNGSEATPPSSPRRFGDADAPAGNNGTVRHSHRQRASAGGFLLEPLSSHTPHRYGSLKGKSKPGQERITTPQHATPDRITRATGDTPPSGRTGSLHGDGQSSNSTPDPAARPLSHNPYMTQSRRHDPAQLVNIALQLNQTRQRQASARFQPHSLGIGNQERVTSNGQVNSNRLASERDRYRQDDEQDGERSLTAGAVIANGLGTQQQDSIGNEGFTDPEGPAALEFLPSPQTLIRAERAKIALELKYHHRRVLQHLPRLPPPRESIVNAGMDLQSEEASVPATFGRAYNPLQYARNRRIRLQRRSSLKPEKEGWNELDRVMAWVAEVAAQRHVQISSVYDNYSLPFFGPSGSELLERSGIIVEEIGHRKQSGRASLPPNDWTVATADLFADIYWLQEGDNRRLIEDHNGDRLFPAAKQLPATVVGPGTSLSELKDRSSGDTMQSKDFIQGSSGSLVLAPQINHESTPVKPSPRGIFEHSPHARKRKSSKAIAQTRHRTRSPSVSSSDGGGANQRKIPRPWSKAFSKRWEGAAIPDKRSLDLPRQSRESQQSGRQSLEVTSGASKQVQRPSIELHRPEEDQDAFTHKRGLLSDLDSTVPSSPVQVATVPSLAVDFDSAKIFGSPPSRRSSPSRREKVKADRHHEVELRDFADDPFQAEQTEQSSNGLSKAYTTTLSSPSETSFSADSDGFSRPQLRRHETERMRPRSPVDGGFRVTKPWKAGKYVAGRVGDLLRRKDYASDTSETDEDTRRSALKLQLSRATTASSARPGTLSRSSTISGVSESPGYRPPEMPSFSPLRREGATGSPSRIKTSETISQMLSKDSDGNALLSPASIDLRSPARSLTPQLSRMHTGEDKNSADSSLRPSSFGIANGRRGATVTDTSGQQWPLPKRSNAPAWPVDPMEDASRLTWTGPELKPTDTNEVTEVDIFRSEAVLKSLCVKAANVAWKFRCVPTNRSTLIEEVRRQHDPDQKPVSKLEEAEVLSRQLTRHIDTHTEGLSNAAENLMSGSIQSLEKQLEDMRAIVQDKLTGMVLAAGDDADGLGHQLAAGLTREVRDINDSIDQILRGRRRRNRVLRRIIFGVLEWLITATMWAVWLIVVIFKLARGVIGLVVAVVRFLFLL